MTTTERIELALIPVTGMSFWWITALLPETMPVGWLLLGMSALLLFQSLIRDLWLIRIERRTAQLSAVRKMRCMCVESTVGATGIVVGAILLGAGWDQFIVMSHWIWSVMAMSIMTFGFLIKEYVVEFSPLRIRQDRDHRSIVFTWKAGPRGSDNSH